MRSKTDDNRSENSEDDLVMPQSRAALANLLTRIRRGEAGYDAARKFLEKTTGAVPPSGV